MRSNQDTLVRKDATKSEEGVSHQKVPQWLSRHSRMNNKFMIDQEYSKQSLGESDKKIDNLRVCAAYQPIRTSEWQKLSGWCLFRADELIESAGMQITIFASEGR